MATSDSNEKKEKNEKTPATEKTVQKRKAFFITPLGDDRSEIRRVTDGLIRAVIEPVLRKHNIDLVPPHKIYEPGTITRQIIRHILESELVIANLTGLNPNVMYELAVRHAKRLPVIIIAQTGTKLPFDLAAERTIFFDNDLEGGVQLFDALDETIPKALNDISPENPIYNGLESLIIRKEVESENNSFDTYVLDRLEQITSSIARIENTTRAKTLGLKAIPIDSDQNKDRRTIMQFKIKNGIDEKTFDHIRTKLNRELPSRLIGVTNNTYMDDTGEVYNLIEVHFRETAVSHQTVLRVFSQVLSSAGNFTFEVSIH
ncbi:hypothetical protein F5984_20440 [Rudanella paleaurantiibacter]|uniref:Nucleoside 2-deoxyribosyltransferase n=1 Tax=Rudanella paleaurantiibacter TaxID=2614655 RepID=A0A7J5TVL0_9BACT|nr:hypothetical protein [Rudanella paleaurantiibacter]KAB7728117.1 hypothetical protein F5984_20440 [Rudanella paleaurantiibacter]